MKYLTVQLLWFNDSRYISIIDHSKFYAAILSDWWPPQHPTNEFVRWKTNVINSSVVIHEYAMYFFSRVILILRPHIFCFLYSPFLLPVFWDWSLPMQVLTLLFASSFGLYCIVFSFFLSIVFFLLPLSTLTPITAHVDGLLPISLFIV